MKKKKFENMTLGETQALTFELKSKVKDAIRDALKNFCNQCECDRVSLDIEYNSAYRPLGFDGHDVCQMKIIINNGRYTFGDEEKLFSDPSVATQG